MPVLVGVWAVTSGDKRLDPMPKAASDHRLAIWGTGTETDVYPGSQWDTRSRQPHMLAPAPVSSHQVLVVVLAEHRLRT